MWSRRSQAAGARDAGSNPDADPVSWRRRRLRNAGFAPELAEAVAADCAIDLHALIELAEHGCPPDLAVRILAPIEGGGRPC